MTIYIDKNYYVDNMIPCEMAAACEAVRLNEPFVVETPYGLQHGNAGDFLIRMINGDYFVCGQHVFYYNFQWMDQIYRHGGTDEISQKIKTTKHN